MENCDTVNVYNFTFKQEKKSKIFTFFSQTFFAQTDVLTETSNESSKNR